MDEVLQALLGILESGRGAVLATILASRGSAPRAAGGRMALEPAGGGGVRIAAGTVGGGLVEARVLAAGALALADGLRRVEDFELTGELAAGADMICGGRLRVLVEPLGPADLGLWRALAGHLEAGRRCLRLTPLDPGRPGAGASVLLAGAAEPAEEPEDALLRIALAAGKGLAAPVELDLGARPHALEPWAPRPALHLFGAGHVARPTAQIAALCGFAITVLDDRAEFASAERFPQARPVVLDSFSDCLAGLACGPEDCVVILTRGHAHDAEVLAQALRTRAGYIGMIGSARKREAVYARLSGLGFGPADFARVRCPVGLDIGAETPEEIAVSIVAELIAHRAGTALGLGRGV